MSDLAPGATTPPFRDPPPPHPLAASDVPDQAVSRYRAAAFNDLLDEARRQGRAQVLAEVDAALRDDEGFRDWWFGSGRILLSTAYRSTLDGAADYLCDTLGGEES